MPGRRHAGRDQARPPRTLATRRPRDPRPIARSSSASADRCATRQIPSGGCCSTYSPWSPSSKPTSPGFVPEHEGRQAKSRLRGKQPSSTRVRKSHLVALLPNAGEHSTAELGDHREELLELADGSACGTGAQRPRHARSTTALSPRGRRRCLLVAVAEPCSPQRQRLSPQRETRERTLQFLPGVRPRPRLPSRSASGWRRRDRLDVWAPTRACGRRPATNVRAGSWGSACGFPRMCGCAASTRLGS